MYTSTQFFELRRFETEGFGLSISCHIGWSNHHTCSRHHTCHFRNVVAQNIERFVIFARTLQFQLTFFNLDESLQQYIESCTYNCDDNIIIILDMLGYRYHFLLYFIAIHSVEKALMFTAVCNDFLYLRSIHLVIWRKKSI